jgi:PAS domain S-box-containing protein
VRSLDVQPALADIESLVSVLPCASLLLAPDAPRFTIVAASDTYLRITATTRATLIGRGLFEVFPERPGEEGVDVLRASLDQVLAAGEPHEIPLQRYDVRRADGSVEERHWRERNSPVFGGHGVVRYVLHTVDDLTESVRSAAALELANRQLADVLGQLDILDQIGDGVIVFDRDWRVAYANSGTERLSGRRSSELRGQIFWDIWPQTVGTEVERQFHHAVASGGPVHLTTPYGIATTDGGVAERWFDVDAHPLTDGLAVFYRDVTERQRTRERTLSDGEL